MEETDSPMTLFNDALSNPVIRNRYEKRLDNFFKFLKMNGDSADGRGASFAIMSKDNKWATSSILKYIRMQKLRDEKKRFQTPHYQITTNQSRYFVK